MITYAKIILFLLRLAQALMGKADKGKLKQEGYDEAIDDVLQSISLDLKEAEARKRYYRKLPAAQRRRLQQSVNRTRSDDEGAD